MLNFNQNTLLLWVGLLFSSMTVHADNANLKLFPLDNYSQNVDQWLNPSGLGYNDNLLTKDYQQQRLEILKHTYYGTGVSDNSPWSKDYIQFLLDQQSAAHNIRQTILSILTKFDNQQAAAKQLIYGLNYHPYPPQWLARIAANINLDQFSKLSYLPANRAIASANLALRSLPTDDPGYYSATIAGEGYPFDNLQQTAVYAGTPLYILATSRDSEWLFVVSLEALGWVHASGVARADAKFIQTWQSVAYQAMAGVVSTNLSIKDSSGNFLFNGYTGMLFPLESTPLTGKISILVPRRDLLGMALLSKVQLSVEDAVSLPLIASPANFARVIKSLQGRPYGWGGLSMYNDCSAEMKAIYSLFGIFLPRNSANQLLAGQLTDLSSYNPKQRLDYLLEHAIPLLTLVKIKGHILLYSGSHREADGKLVALSYQQMWGLSPADRSYRAVIGQAVFLPLLLSYPEDLNLKSELANSQFILIYLNQLPAKPLKQGLDELFYNN